MTKRSGPNKWPGTQTAEVVIDGYFGSLTDKFGVQWMFNCPEAKPAV